MVEQKPPIPEDGINTSKPGLEFNFTAKPPRPDHEKDVDIDPDSVHHTLGKGPTNAAAGKHTHRPEDLEGLSVEHGGMEGLEDDDHGAYPLKSGLRAHGTWDISITGNADSATEANTALVADSAATADFATTADNASNAVNASQAANADHAATADRSSTTGPAGITFNWDGRSSMPYWVFGGNSHTDCYVVHLENFFSLVGHGHSYAAPGGIEVIHHNFGTLQPGQQLSLPFSRRNDQYPVVSVGHPSTYIFAVVESLYHLGFTVEMRNSTAGTVHTNVTAIIVLLSNR